MIALGLNAYLHDSAAALACDGEVVAAVEEERLSRQKYTGEFPQRAVQYCLDRAGMGAGDVDAVGFAWNPYLELVFGLRHFLRYLPGTLAGLRGGATDVPLVPRILKTAGARRDFVRRFGPAARHPRFTYVGHHLAHAASAFYPSPFERAAVLVMDGLGDNWDAVTVWAGDGNRLRFVRNIRFPHSVGGLYWCVTRYLGFDAHSGEGKVMGLSSYGTPACVDDFKRLVRYGRDGAFYLDLGQLSLHLAGNNVTTSRAFQARYGPPRRRGEGLEPRHADVALALQRLTEDIVLHLGRYVRVATGMDRVCIAGGAGLNCVANGALVASGIFREVWVQAASHDGGTALGAALHLAHGAGRAPRRPQPVSHAYLGPEYDDAEVGAALAAYGDRLRFEACPDPAREAARLVAAGQLVGWHQGRLEYGPRALGNRSILADPRRAEMKDVLNHRVKFREGFRPFAPTVLADRAAEYFVGAAPSPFMSFAFPVVPDKCAVIPAVTHVDGTARIQTVDRDQNPLYFRLIEEFGRLTGVPVVLNTSYNVRGEPIVCRPQEAIDCLLSTGLDALVIGGYVAFKAGGPAAEGSPAEEASIG